LKNQLSEKLKLIGFTSVTIDEQGYLPGKINLIS
jgi:PP-loop superfamily ATP-utilizing enzyme